jgi:hypothetical protein
MEKNPFREVVKTIRVVIRKLEYGSEDEFHLHKVGVPLQCAGCGDKHTEEEPIELAEVIVLVDQKILLPDKGLTDDYLTNPFVVLYCSKCWNTVFVKETPDLPFYQ